MANQSRTARPDRTVVPTARKKRQPKPSDTTMALLARGNYRTIHRIAGVSPQHVARVIRGEKGASFHVAARIANAAGVTLDELYAHITRSRSLRIKGRRTLADFSAYGTDVVRESLKRKTVANAARI